MPRPGFVDICPSCGCFDLVLLRGMKIYTVEWDDGDFRDKVGLGYVIGFLGEVL